MGRVGTIFRNAITLVGAVAVSIVIPSGGAVARTGIKDVHYRGLTLAVPVSWPVFRLSDGSRTCVRFNRHALYLGQPSLDQACPANALGRTEAILVQPTLGSGRGAAVQATGAGELRLVRDGLAVTATWGRDPALVERALGLDGLPQATHALPQATGGGQAQAAPSVARRPPAGRLRQHRRALAASAAGSAQVGPSTYTGLAFDTCSVPTSAQLSAWKGSPYHGMGVYIGGANAGCAQPNLTSSWISSVTGAGWHLLLIYVGLQAPRNSCGCAPIQPASAAAEGSAAADDAAGRAAALGVGQGSPIYFDMEGYTERWRIRDAVLSFLAAWTSELHHDGYRSGVYSSADSGIADLVSRYGSGYPEPDDLWFADWNGQPGTIASYIPGTDWTSHQRAHQFLGPHNLRYGGLRISVDSDFVDGATVGSDASSTPPSGPPGSPSAGGRPPKKPGQSGKAGQHRSGRPPAAGQLANPTGNGDLVEVRGTHSVYRIVGGAPLLVRYWRDIGGRQPVRQISRRRFDELRAVPANGSVIYTATGTVYRIAGGFPFVLTRSLTDHSAGQLIDLWDLHHLSDPRVHLRAVPTSGTVIQAAPSGRFWIFRDDQLLPARRSPGATPVPHIDLSQWRHDCPGTGGRSGGSGVSASCQPGSSSGAGRQSGGGGLAQAVW